MRRKVKKEIRDHSINAVPKDHSAGVGLGTGIGGAAVSGGTMVALTGGSASASAITYALAAVGSVVGGGMAAGLGLLIGGPAALGAGAYGVAKLVKKHKEKKVK